MTSDKLVNYDITTPFSFISSLQIYVKRGSDSPTAMFVIEKLISSVSPLAQIIAAIILLCVMIFGHIISAAENLKLASKRDFSDNYFGASQDGMWFSIIAMSTVGFGDVVPRTSIGRFFAILWIFISIILMAILFSIVAANFSVLVLVPDRAIYSVNGPYDLTPYTVGVASSYAKDRLLQRMPNLTLVTFPEHGQAQALAALMNNTIDAVVDQYEILQYYNELTTPFTGKLRPVGNVFNQIGVGIAVRRINGTLPHPLFHYISLGVADATLRDPDWQQALSRAEEWFGQPFDSTAADPDQGTAEDGVVSQVKMSLLAVVGALFAGWACIGVVLMFFRYPSYLMRVHLVDVVSKLAGVQVTGTIAVVREQALEGLTKFVPLCPSTDKGPPDLEKNKRKDSMVDMADLLESTRRGSSKRNIGEEVLKELAALRVDTVPPIVGPKLSVRLFLKQIEQELIASKRFPGFVGDYDKVSPRDGREETMAYELAREHFMISYNDMQGLIPHWKAPYDDMDLSLDGMVDVVADIVMRGYPGLLGQGGPVFPFVEVDGEAQAADRSFEQMLRRLRALSAQTEAVIKRVEEYTGRRYDATNCSRAVSPISRNSTSRPQTPLPGSLRPQSPMPPPRPQSPAPVARGGESLGREAE